jgi:hypothetical protein
MPRVVGERERPPILAQFFVQRQHGLRMHVGTRRHCSVRAR